MRRYLESGTRYDITTKVSTSDQEEIRKLHALSIGTKVDDLGRP